MAGIQAIWVIAGRLNATAQETFRPPSFLHRKPPGAMAGESFPAELDQTWIRLGADRPISPTLPLPPQNSPTVSAP